MKRGLLSLALSAACAVAARAQMTAPPTLSMLFDVLLESPDPEKRLSLLPEIARTPMTTTDDAAKSLEVFSRFPDDDTRAAVIASVESARPSNRELEQAFLAMINTDEPEALLIGLRGAGRLKSASARPRVLKLAKRKFRARLPTELVMLSEREAWWTHFEAVYALARIDGDAGFDFVKGRVAQSPLLARILALQYWDRALPLAVKWAKGTPAEKEAAAEALAAPVTTPALRATREAMLALLRDPKEDREIRHQVALKIGVSSLESEIPALIAEHDAAADEQTKLLLASAVFSSRSRGAEPLLIRYMKENPDAGLRAGARAQLKNTLPAAEYRALVEWAAKNDPSPTARLDAAKELAALAP